MRHYSLLAALLTIIACSGPASAFELSRTSTGQHLRWQRATDDPITYTIDDHLAADLKLGEAYTRSVIIQSMKTWEAVQCDLCHDPAGIACEPVVCAKHPLGMRFDHDPKWAPQGNMLGPSCVGPAGEVTGITAGACPSTGGPWKKQANGNQIAFLTGDEWVFSQYTIALTLVAANQVSGEIIDTDILVNARDKKFCATDCKSNEYDLQSTITHEAGHMLGLDHSSVNGATMVLQGNPGEEYMRTLSADDIEGVCRAYRMAYSPDGCPPPEDGWFDCGAAPRSGDFGQTAWLLLFAVAVVMRRRFTRVGSAGL